MSVVQVLLGIFITAPSCFAHVALWNKGMFGLNYPGQANDTYQHYNNNVPVAPLRGFDSLTTDEWFAHGLKAYPPKEGDFMELEAGGSFLSELSCNRAWTTLRSPADDMKELEHFACPAIGPLHTANRFNKELNESHLAGTALAIAYTSDVASLQPSDMTVISVNYTSVWTREVVYPIPPGLPPCPEGGCLCTWNWIHQAGNGEGYGEEIYNVLYRCNLTGATNANRTLPIGGGQVPVHCPHASANCTLGAKQPIYVFQADGNNMDTPPIAPSYNWRYGFKDGAQLDLFNLPTAIINVTVDALHQASLGAEDLEPSKVSASSLPSSTGSLPSDTTRGREPDTSPSSTRMSAKFGLSYLRSHSGQHDGSSTEEKQKDSSCRDGRAISGIRNGVVGSLGMVCHDISCSREDR